MHVLASTQMIHFIPITKHHRFLLRPAPTFDTPFSRKCILARGEFLRPHQRYGQPRCRIAAAHAALMLTKAVLQIVRVPSVVSAIRTLEDINPEHDLSSLLETLQQTIQLIQTAKVDSQHARTLLVGLDLHRCTELVGEV